MSGLHEQSGQLSGSSYSNHGKSLGFGMNAMRKHPAVIPMVVIIGGVVVGVSAWCSYAFATKMDVQPSKKARWETLDLSKPQPTKLFTIQQQYRAMPELNNLLREMDEADRKN